MLSDLIKVTKPDVATHVKIRMLQSNPEWSQYVTRRLILDALIFIDGFGRCLIEYVEPPYNEDDIKSFLKEEAFIFVYSKIEIDQSK